MKFPCKTTTFSCWSEYSEIEPPKTSGAMLCNAVDDVLDGLGGGRGGVAAGMALKLAKKDDLKPVRW